MLKSNFNLKTTPLHGSLPKVCVLVEMLSSLPLARIIMLQNKYHVWIYAANRAPTVELQRMSCKNGTRVLKHFYKRRRATRATLLRGGLVHHREKKLQQICSVCFSFGIWWLFKELRSGGHRKFMAYLFSGQNLLLLWILIFETRRVFTREMPQRGNSPP